MAVPFIFEDHEVCLILQAHRQLAALQESLELKVLFWQCNSGPQKRLYLTLNLISVMFECKVSSGKAALSTVQRFLSLQNVKLPIGVYWPDVPDQICHQGKLCGGC